MPAVAVQGRYWLLTIPVDKWNIPDTWSEDIQYCRGQQEIGEGGYHHWQILCALKSKKRMLATKNLFCREAHLELTRSDAADDYVWKEDTKVPGTEFEYGTRAVRRNNATDWKKVKDAAISGDLSSVPEDIFVRHYGNLTRIAKDHARPGFREGTKCNVYWGPTGTGKSHRAFGEGPGAYVKNPNIKWWDGYQGEETVIIDEFSGLIDITYLLRWIDRYPCMVEVKGGAVVLNAKTFIITSNLSPEQWYPNASENHKAALQRRLTTVIHMDRPYVSEPEHRQHPTLALDSEDSDWEWAVVNHPF